MTSFIVNFIVKVKEYLPAFHFPLLDVAEVSIPLDLENPFLEPNTTHDHNLLFRHIWSNNNVQMYVHGGSNLQIETTVDVVFSFPKTIVVVLNI
jgi:hypothetical protein